MLTPTKGIVGVMGAAGDGRPIRVVASLLLVMITGFKKNEELKLYALERNILTWAKLSV